MPSELEQAQKKLDQAKARLQKAQTKERLRVRKDDARTKIIIGGAMLALIKDQSPENAAKTVAMLVKRMSDRDRALVEPKLQSDRSDGS
jgi:hypothetical protein